MRFCLRVCRLLISGSYPPQHLTRCSTNLISNHHLLYIAFPTQPPWSIWAKKLAIFMAFFVKIEGQHIRPPRIVLASNFFKNFLKNHNVCRNKGVMFGKFRLKVWARPELLIGSFDPFVRSCPKTELQIWGGSSQH